MNGSTVVEDTVAAVSRVMTGVFPTVDDVLINEPTNPDEHASRRRMVREKVERYV
jgi:hypothetical protein